VTKPQKRKRSKKSGSRKMMNKTTMKYIHDQAVAIKSSLEHALHGALQHTVIGIKKIKRKYPTIGLSINIHSII
jgi:hypothetical protein